MSGAAANSRFLDAASLLRRAGFRVFPLKPGCKRPLPGFRDWGKRATTDAAQIERWAARTPDANVAIITGGEWFVLDVDPRHSGDRTLAQLEANHGRLPDTVTAHTGGGGTHFYFRGPPGIGNRTGIRPGLDIKGVGGYVVGPGSKTAKPYRWLDGRNPGAIEMAEAPAWLIELIGQGQAGGKPGAKHGQSTGKARAKHRQKETRARATAAPRVSRQVDALYSNAPIVEGTRNTTLCALAGSFRARGMGGARMRAALNEVNDSRCEPAYPRCELAAIARWIETKAAGKAKGAGVGPDYPPLPDGMFVVELRAYWKLAPGPQGYYRWLRTRCADGFRRHRDADAVEALGVSRRTVIRWRQALRDAGVIAAIDDGQGRAPGRSKTYGLAYFFPLVDPSEAALATDAVSDGCTWRLQVDVTSTTRGSGGDAGGSRDAGGTDVPSHPGSDSEHPPTHGTDGASERDDGDDGVLGLEREWLSRNVERPGSGARAANWQGRMALMRRQAFVAALEAIERGRASWKAKGEPPASEAADILARTLGRLPAWALDGRSPLYRAILARVASSTWRLGDVARYVRTALRADNPAGVLWRRIETSNVGPFILPKPEPEPASPEAVSGLVSRVAASMGDDGAKPMGDARTAQLKAQAIERFRRWDATRQHRDDTG